MAEIAAAASECEHRTLHMWPDVGYTEIIDDGHSSSGADSGDLVCTGLLNADMPLIRYRTGDRGRLGPRGERCGCGRTLPSLAAVEGRSDDVLYASDGRRVGRLDPVFKADLPIHEAQIVQETLRRIRVRYVPAPGFSRSAETSIADRLRDRLGSIEIVFESLGRIPRTASGKFRAVVCAITPELRPDRIGLTSPLMRTP
jgi:phenylacetate-CoA ligase